MGSSAVFTGEAEDVSLDQVSCRRAAEGGRSEMDAFEAVRRNAGARQLGGGARGCSRRSEDRCMGRDSRSGVLGIMRATRASFEDNIAGEALSALVIHCAMVSAVTTAARGQGGFVVRGEGERERPGSEEEH
jgi:hypothetical protein